MTRDNYLNWEVLSTLSEEKAVAAKKALEQSFPVLVTTSHLNNEFTPDYKVFIRDNQCGYTKRDYQRWISGFLFAKFGE